VQNMNLMFGLESLQDCIWSQVDFNLKKV
jgi:hypothetical protein